MNIFYLDPDQKECAKMHVDMHVNKMIVESAQMLCTAINTEARHKIAPYKSFNPNHPCNFWVRESLSNFVWLHTLMLQLKEEWNYRKEHDKDHVSVCKLQDYDIVTVAAQYFKDVGFTTPAMAMPHKYVEMSPVQSYREYYKYEKWHLHQWTRREIPQWIL